MSRATGRSRRGIALRAQQEHSSAAGATNPDEIMGQKVLFIELIKEEEAICMQNEDSAD